MLRLGRLSRSIVRALAAPTLVAALSASACGSSKSAPPGVEWLADGAGEANAEPLELIRPGRRAFSGDLWGNATTFRGRQVLGSTRDAIYRETTDGIVVDGTFSGGFYDRPLLVIPRTVRVGMKWSSTGSAVDGAIVFEVESREVRLTPFGRRPVWVIGWNFASGGRQPHVYVEGRGEDPGSGPRVDASIVPLDEPRAVTEVDLPEVQPTPLLGPDGKQLSWTDTNLGTATLLDPGMGGARTIALSGGQSAIGLDGTAIASASVICLKWDGATASIVQPTLASGLYYKGPGCPASNPTSGMVHWRAGHTAIVLPDGTYWPNGGPAMAVFANPDHGASYLERTSVGHNLVQVTDWSMFGSAYGGPQRRLFGMSDAATWSMNDYDADAKFAPAAMLTGPGPADAWPTWDPSFGFVDWDSRIWPTRVHADTLEPPLPAAGLIGSLSHTTRLDGRTTYLSSFGHVDRLVVTNDGLHRSRVANVALPAGHTLVSAVEDAGRLLIFSVLTRPRSWSNPAAIGDGFAWTVPLGTPVDEPIDAQLGVRARWLGAHAQVCWPASSEPFDPTGWKIRGVPAAAVLADSTGRCALVVRDFDAMAADVWQGSAANAPLDWNSLEGKIPGLGRVAFGGGVPSVELLPYRDRLTDLAALPGGGAVGTNFYYAPGGVALGTPANAHDAPARAFVDPGGNGLWSWGTKQKTSAADTETYALLYRGATSLRVVLPTTTTGQYKNPTPAGSGEGGGVILTLGDDTWFVSPDGKYETLPVTANTRWVRHRRKNGLYCGTNGAQRFCMDAAGIQVLSKPADGLELTAVGWVALGDGSLLFARSAAGSQPLQLVRVDPDTFAAAPYPDATRPATALLSLQVDAHGQLWGALKLANGDQVGGRLGPTGCEPIDSMKWASTQGAGAGGIAPSEIYPFDEMTVVYGIDKSGKAVTARYFPAK